MSITWEEITNSRFKFKNNERWYKVTNNVVTIDALGADHKFQSCVLSERYKDFVESVWQYQVNTDDIWIITHPRSGTTWMQELVWLIANNLDYKEARKILLRTRSPTIRKLLSTIEDQSKFKHDWGITVDGAQDLKRPYIIKNHLPAAFLPKSIWTVKPKIIYVARNPKDVAASMYFIYQSYLLFEGTIDEYFELFLNDLTEFGPHYQHVMEFYMMRNEPNIFFVTYEEMSCDLRKVIRMIAQFLDKVISDEDLEVLFNHLQLDAMKENPSCNMKDLVRRAKEDDRIPEGFKKNHIRSGKVAESPTECSREKIPIEFLERYDEYIERHYKEINHIFQK